MHCGPLGPEVVKACNQMIVGIDGGTVTALIAEGAGSASTNVRHAVEEVGRQRGAVAKRRWSPRLQQHRRGEVHGEGPRSPVQAAQASRRLPLSSQALEIYQGLVEAGLGDDDLAVVHKYLAQNTTR